MVTHLTPWKHASAERTPQGHDMQLQAAMGIVHSTAGTLLYQCPGLVAYPPQDKGMVHAAGEFWD